MHRMRGERNKRMIDRKARKGKRGSYMKRMKIITKATGDIVAELFESSETANEIWKRLPFEGTINTWGEEIYFEIPVKMELENGKQEVERGDIAYWVEGNAMCIFFGPTPISEEDKPKAYTKVKVFARIIGDAKVFRKVKDGEKIWVERAK